jgi:hypothetical protein
MLLAGHFEGDWVVLAFLAVVLLAAWVRRDS